MWTDHKPLTFVLSHVSDSWIAKQQRQLSYIAEFTANIPHIPGKLNVVANLMSRPPVAVPAHEPAQAAGLKALSRSLVASLEAGGTSWASPLQEQLFAAVTVVGVDLEAMSSAQQSCEGIKHLLANPSLTIRGVALGHQFLQCDFSCGGRRLWCQMPGRKKRLIQSTHWPTLGYGPQED